MYMNWDVRPLYCIGVERYGTVTVNPLVAGVIVMSDLQLAGWMNPKADQRTPVMAASVLSLDPGTGGRMSPCRKRCGGPTNPHCRAGTSQSEREFGCSPSTPLPTPYPTLNTNPWKNKRDCDGGWLSSMGVCLACLSQ